MLSDGALLAIVLDDISVEELDVRFAGARFA